jgi:4-amino-4-deoxy-L-arabinose transferase-like glycosyltransferase
MTFINNYPLTSLSLLFVVMNAVLFAKLGVFVDSDSERYLAYAAEIKERGLFFKPHEFWYIGYPLFILAVTSIVNSLSAVVATQVLLSYLTLHAVYLSALKLHRNAFAACLSGLLFLGFFMISYWNFWIYCESLLISMTCISFYLLLVWWQGKRSLSFTALTFLVIGYTFFVKPTGVAFLAGLLTMGLPFAWKRIKPRSARMGAVCPAIAAFLMFLNQMLATFGLIRDYATGEIVYNITNMAHQEYAKWLIITPPNDLYLPDENQAALINEAKLFFANPLYSLQLVTTKVFFYLAYIRPYFSMTHNLAALALLIPVYIAFAKALTSEDLPLSLRLFTGTFMLISVFSSALLTVDWNSRFLVVVLPLLFVFSSKFLANWVQTYLPRLSKIYTCRIL